MKRVMTYLAAGLLTMTYLLSYIGFGVHTCSCSGSRQVILLFNNLSCERIHAHIHILGSHEHQCEHGHRCEHDHQDGCCHTDIMVLTDDQDDCRQTEFVNVEYHTLGFAGHHADNASLAVFRTVPCLWQSDRAGFLPVPDTPVRYREVLPLISVWRI